MSDIIQKLFHLAMDELPYIPNPTMDKAEEALEERLGQEGRSLLKDYEDAWYDHCWEDARRVFYIGLALGIELGALTPSAGACRRR